MLRRLLGAALLVGGCAAAGLRQSCDLRRRVRRLDELRDKVERLRTEVCFLQTPLPEILSFLTGRAADSGAWLQQPFGEVWDEAIRWMGLDGEESRVLMDLGAGLRRGDEPERVFAAAEGRLQKLRLNAEHEAESKCRLCSAMGLCTGLLLAIVLI